jgi:EmrB/QacA subfamily drug resistance transporter
MIDGHKSPCDEGVIETGAEPAPCARADRPWVLAATILGSSLAFITGSVVNVALPAIQVAFSATAAQMQWVINSYLLFLGALILVGGAAGDRFGRRRVFVTGIAVFTGASVWCGFAASASELILARGVQGLGGALLVPGSLAIISASFPKDERGAAIGTWAGFSALTTAFGPVLGGWLVDMISWRGVFFVIVPFALVCMAVTLWRVPESRDDQASTLDWGGAALATLGLGALVYGLIAAGTRGWGDPVVLMALAIGGIGLGTFLGWEARASAPMMPLPLFRQPTFSGANLVTLLLYFALNGALFFLPFNLMQVQGYTATQAGAAFLPFTMLVGGLSRWAGGLVDRYGARRPLVLGPLIVAAGFAGLVLPSTGGSYWATFFPGLLIIGLGMSISVAPLTTVVMNAASERHAGVASGINNAAARVAGLLAIAVLGVVAMQLFAGALEARLAQVEVPPAAEQVVWAARYDLAGAAVPTDVSASTQQALRGAIDAAFIESFRWIMGIAAGLALASALCAALTIPARAVKPNEADSTADATDDEATG